MWFEGLGAVESVGKAPVGQRGVVQCPDYGLGSVAGDLDVERVAVEAAVAPGEAAGYPVAPEAEPVAQVGTVCGDRSCHLCKLLRCQEVPAEERAEERRDVLDRGDDPAVAAHRTTEALHLSQPGRHPLGVLGAVAGASEVEATNDPVRHDLVE